MQQRVVVKSTYTSVWAHGESDDDNDTGETSESDTDSFFARDSSWMGTGKQSTGCCAWLFKGDTNPRYARNLALALRCSIVAMCLTVALVIHEDHSLFRSWDDFNFNFPSGASMMFVFTVVPCLGDTLDLARSGVLGTFLSILAACTMQNLFPDGADTAQGFWAMVVFENVFVLGILLLNLNMNTRIFALSSFVFHAMTFLNPAAKLDLGFEKFSFSSAGVMELMGAVLGCGLAVMTTLLPTPLLALMRAGRIAGWLAAQLDETWSVSISYMAGSTAETDISDRICKKMAGLKEQLVELQTAIDSAYYEVAVLPRRFGMKRLMLQRSLLLLREGFDRAFSVFYSCQEEGFESSHQEFMDIVKQDLVSVHRESFRLVRLCVAAALDGRISGHEAKDMRRYVASTDTAMHSLTVAAVRARVKVFQPSSPLDVVGEQCICLHMCAAARMATGLAEDFLAHCSGEQKLDAAPAPAGSALRIDTAPDHLSFVLRNFLTIQLGMLVGGFGYHNYLAAYNAGIACTSSILLTKFTGSAISKGLVRLHGVVLGNIFGQFMYGLFAWCNYIAYGIVALIAFLWTAGTMMTYFHVPQSASITCLLAAYGLTQLGKQCSDEFAHPSMAPIINMCMAIVLALCIDALAMVVPLPEGIKLSHTSKQATKAIDEMWKSLREVGSDALDAESAGTRQHRMRFATTLAAAKELGSEASQEVTYQSAPWKSELFTSLMASVTTMWMTTSTIEHTASGGADGGDKIDAYMRVLRLLSMKALRAELLDEIDSVGSMLEVLARDRVEVGSIAEHYELVSEGSEEAVAKARGECEAMSVGLVLEILQLQPKMSAATLGHLMRELSQSAGPAGLQTLEEDGFSIGCALLECCRAVDRDLRSMRRSTLQAQ